MYKHGLLTLVSVKHRVFSMTKVLASTVAMMLVEAKALDLEAPVADYIPSFKVRIHTIHYRFICTGLFAGEG